MTTTMMGHDDYFGGTTAYLLHTGASHRVYAIRTAQHPHTAHREIVVQMEGGYRGLGAPVKLSRTPATYRFAPLAEGDAFLPQQGEG